MLPKNACNHVKWEHEEDFKTWCADFRPIMEKYAGLSYASIRDVLRFIVRRDIRKSFDLFSLIIDLYRFVVLVVTLHLV